MVLKLDRAYIFVKCIIKAHLRLEPLSKLQNSS